jgi:hypothetical protein
MPEILTHLMNQIISISGAPLIILIIILLIAGPVAIATWDALSQIYHD